METIEAKQVKNIINATFPDYRKRKVFIVPRKTVTFNGVNWSGGSRSEYRACSIDGQKQGKLVNMGQAAPWENPFEGMKVDLPLNTVIVEGGYFCGKKSTLCIYVNPENMPLLLK